ncbi:MAG: acyl-CoA dehydrogenase [Caulobacter sp.]|nr:acyl-CoA dehydrogenase [Caulobacter sp.]
MSLILSRRDMDFLLFEWLDVEGLLTRPRYAEHDRETLNAVLDLAQQLAEDLFAPHNKMADANEPRMLADGAVAMPAATKTALDALSASGLLAASQSTDVGGMQLPFVVDKAAFAWLQAASAGISGYALLTMAAANLLIEHGSAEQIERYAKPLLQGRFFGTMCLSEPQAGSSLGDIRTRAERDGQGAFRLFGSKMWISGGEHSLSESIVHLVLARIDGAPAGVKGLSLFIVPRDLPTAEGGSERNDVTLAGLNHKMGQRGTVNTLLNFGEGQSRPGGESGAVAYLVGREGAGLSAMFTMMNEARISVGASAAALGYTGYLHSLDYARQRPQGRPAGAKDATSPQVPIIRHADVKRMLLAQKAYAEGALALNFYCARLVDDLRTGPEAESAAVSGLLDLLTPIAKSWPSQFCLEANALAIQVLGGYGYTRDFNVEQFYRDNRLNPIHEGAHGIQAIDLLGRKVVIGQGAAFEEFQRRVARSCKQARALGGEESEHASAVETLLAAVVETTAVLHAADDPELTLANASQYLEAFGHLTIGWIWLEQLIAAHGKVGDFYDGKRAAARYFRLWELPRTGPMLALLSSLDRTTLDLEPAWL